jgi:hypothetical protein
MRFRARLVPDEIIVHLIKIGWHFTRTVRSMDFARGRERLNEILQSVDCLDSPFAEVRTNGA